MLDKLYIIIRIGLLIFSIHYLKSFNNYKYKFPHEGKHIKIMRETASECTLFLKRNEEFPISQPCNALLVGSGARNTEKSGFGSGDNDPSNYTTCEEGLENSGFFITSKIWLDQYPKLKETKIGEHLKYLRNMSIKYNITQSFREISFPEYDYKLSLNFEKKADIAIYVLSRNSGEGLDRREIKGDIYLTDTEIKDILYLNRAYKKFMLVLNVGGVVDLSPVQEVSNILLLSQLGIVTGDILADIILGKTNPSGKLATTWTRYKDYNTNKNFGFLDSVKYKEGVYLGYRYFDSAQITPLYPFGFGLSYTEFIIDKINLKNDREKITISIKVKNIGKYSGKEVVQVYISPSQENMDKPYQSLISFKKTPKLKPNEEAELNIDFKLSQISRYDTETASYVLDKGNYIIRVGNSSRNTKVFGYINLEENIIIQKLKNVILPPDFKDYVPDISKYPKDDLNGIQKISLKKEDFDIKITSYNNYVPKIYDNIKKLNNTELAYLCIGGFVESKEENNEKERGLNGLTTNKVKSIKKYLRMADGAAGIRIARVYTDDNGLFKRLSPDPARLHSYHYLNNKKNISLTLTKNEKEDYSNYSHIIYQYPTALPTPTAQAQTFNVELMEKYGDILGKEMNIYNINILLSPAMNIHRNPLCGRNFEYFSEDPLLSGKISAAIIRGVQSHKNCGTTIKHFTGNNQELNRKKSNSIMSERALREIYFKGFEIAIEDGHPKALMTSYNLINGIHPSEDPKILIDVVRNEWKFNGLIMTDWAVSGKKEYNKAKYPEQFVYNTLKAGVNLHMTGHIIDYNFVIQKLEEKVLDREDLLKCGSKVYETIELLNK